MTAMDFGENMGFRSSTVPIGISLALGRESYARLSLSTVCDFVSRALASLNPFGRGLLMLALKPDIYCIFKTFGNG